MVSPASKTLGVNSTLAANFAWQCLVIVLAAILVLWQIHMCVVFFDATRKSFDNSVAQ